MFKRRKEMQSLIDASRKSLAEAEETIEELTFECKELKEKLYRIEGLATSNTYGNDKAILGKLKEVIRRQNEITSRHVKINSYIYSSTNMYEKSRRKYEITR